MSKIVLDVSFTKHETADDAISELTRDLPVNSRVLREHGPAGGWPEVEFDGADVDLAEVRRRGGYDV
jgi:hypothetical protein